MPLQRRKPRFGRIKGNPKQARRVRKDNYGFENIDDLLGDSVVEPDIVQESSIDETDLSVANESVQGSVLDGQGETKEEEQGSPDQSQTVSASMKETAVEQQDVGDVGLSRGALHGRNLQVSKLTPVNISPGLLDHSVKGKLPSTTPVRRLSFTGLSTIGSGTITRPSQTIGESSDSDSADELFSLKRSRNQMDDLSVVEESAADMMTDGSVDDVDVDVTGLSANLDVGRSQLAPSPVSPKLVRSAQKGSHQSVKSQRNSMRGDGAGGSVDNVDIDVAGLSVNLEMSRSQLALSPASSKKVRSAPKGSHQSPKSRRSSMRGDGASKGPLHVRFTPGSSPAKEQNKKTTPGMLSSSRRKGTPHHIPPVESFVEEHEEEEVLGNEVRGSVTSSLDMSRKKKNTPKESDKRLLQKDLDEEHSNRSRPQLVKADMTRRHSQHSPTASARRGHSQRRHAQQSSASSATVLMRKEEGEATDPEQTPIVRSHRLVDFNDELPGGSTPVVQSFASPELPIFSKSASQRKEGASTTKFSSQNHSPRLSNGSVFEFPPNNNNNYETRKQHQPAKEKSKKHMRSTLRSLVDESIASMHGDTPEMERAHGNKPWRFGVSPTSEIIDGRKTTKSSKGKRPARKAKGRSAKRQHDSSEGEETEEDAGPFTKARKERVFVPVSAVEDSADDGVRRSKRVRLPPVQYWRNETVVYQREQSGFAIKGVQRPAGFTSTPPIFNILRPPRQRKKKKGPASDYSEDEEMSDTASTIQESSQCWAAVNLNEEGTEIQDVEVAVSSSEAKRRLKQVGPGEGLQVAKCFCTPAMTAGYSELEPGATKSSGSVLGHSLVFGVYAGSISATIAGEVFYLNQGAMFRVPQFNSYFLKNSGKVMAKLFFFHTH